MHRNDNRDVNPAVQKAFCCRYAYALNSQTNEQFEKSNTEAMNRNWSNQKANPALKTKGGN